MNRATKIVVGLLGAAAVAVVAVVTACVNESNRRDAMRQGLESKAAVLKAELMDRFPVGSPKSDVVAFLDARATGFRSGGEGDYWLSVGQEPGRLSEWYCGKWEVGVEATFRKGLFVRADVTRWSTDCL